MKNFEEGEILLFNKDLTWTSFDLVNKARNIIRKSLNKRNIKVGHAGTLDPLATGLMIVCTGKATKTIDQFMGLNKTYITTIEFGRSTPSFDLETEVDQTKDYQHITKELLLQTLQQFEGPQDQIPPIFSAININGKRAYQLARKGIVAELKSKPITIYKIELLEFDLPKVTLQIHCSKGTYIRSIARDLGLALDTVAYLTKLERTQIGDYHIDQAIDIKQFENQFNITL